MIYPLHISQVCCEDKQNVKHLKSTFESKLYMMQNDNEIHEHNMKYVSVRSLPGITFLSRNSNKQHWKATLIELYFY